MIEFVEERIRTLKKKNKPAKIKKFDPEKYFISKI